MLKLVAWGRNEVKMFYATFTMILKELHGRNEKLVAGLEKLLNGAGLRFEMLLGYAQAMIEVIVGERFGR